MSEFHRIKVGDAIISPIDWEMDPLLSFGTFESWGGRERVRNNNECVYYFFIDNWGDKPKLCLMERAVKHARVMADIKAPLEMIEDCIAGQGTAAIFEKSYGINSRVKQWLIDNVLDGNESDLVVPREEKTIHEDMGPALEKYGSAVFEGSRVLLPAESAVIQDEELEDIIKKWNFFDRELNSEGAFTNYLVEGEDDDTIVDLKTSLMWQRGGIDIGSIRHIQRKITELNERGFAGYSDWRLPTMEEAMSLMEPVKNGKEIYLNPCFSREQPFIFVDALRKPGGYWFVDYKQGRAFWSSGTIPGGFGRLVRTM